jgi:3',5'-cyclic AMP phosphodiesterase CpdA
MFCFGHLSDLHATPVIIDNPTQLLNKRFFGWLSWRLRRRRVHRAAVVEALIADLKEVAPDHVLVTGDLTNISLDREFAAARVWLERLGSPPEVSIVPGNHDAYVGVPASSSWNLWSEYWVSDADDSGLGVPLGSDPREQFPTLRVRGPLAVVGLCSALPTPIFDASGTLGDGQLERLERMLSNLDDGDLCRVVSIHHPVSPGATHERRELRDAAALRGVLRRAGAELVVHGHNHRTLFAEIEGPDGVIPVVGVRSASDIGRKPHKCAQYHVYAIERNREPGHPRFRIALRVRGYDPTSGRFRAELERDLVSGRTSASSG